MAGRQLRLLLWKDYLMRKRQPITVAGILWAVGVISTICIVRYNIDNQDFPTCQFAARALPSAGLLTFLQSFICNINNECSPMEDFQEIPTYEKSKLTQLKNQLAPLIYNESVIEVAGSIPDTLKLLSTLAEVADEPAFLDITKNGIYVEDLFRNPKRVSRYLSDSLGVPDDVADSVMSAQIGLGAIGGDIDRCSKDSMVKLIKIKNPKHLSVFVERLCAITKDDLQKHLIKLLLEMDIGKYVTMAGNMYGRLAGDARLARLGAMTSAALRVLSAHSFWPPELSGIVYGEEADFSYFPLTMVNKFLNLFQPTFGNTQSYKTLKDMTDSIILGVKYLSRVLKKENDTRDSNQISESAQLNRMSNLVNNALSVAQELPATDTPLDVFDILTRITNLILKFLSKDQKHDILFYSTLLSKLLEVADKMVNINTNIDQVIYDVSLRNPAGVRVLLTLPPPLVASGLEGLADPERAQIITSNLGNPAQPFCDLHRLSKFFLVSKEEAASLKSQLCTDEWKAYVQDMITSFGTYEAKNNINSIASLFVMNTIGSDVSDQLYTIEKDFEIFKNFTQLIANLDEMKKPELNWSIIFNQQKDAQFLKVVKEKEGLGKLILLTVHGCLAKEVVKQNPLLEFKISPFLKDTTAIVGVINEQLKLSSKETAERAKTVYADLLTVLAMTALDEDKTYKSLSTPSRDIFCRGPENASLYLNFPPHINRSSFADVLCDVSIEIENGLNADSVVAKGIAAVKSANHSVLEEINWTKLIKGLKHLYMTLEQDYPYVLQFRSYGMDRQTQSQVELLIRQAKDYWFSFKSWKRILLLTVNVGLRLLDLLDSDAFGLAPEGWLRARCYLAGVTGPLDVVNDFVQLLHGISKNESPQTDVPVKTSAVLQAVLAGLPQVAVETVDVIVRGDVEVEPIIAILNAEPPWPCGPSLAGALPYSPSSEQVVRSLETLVCFDRTFQTEWKLYFDQKNVTLYKTAQWNTTRFAPHVFLKFSSAFDRTVSSLEAIGEIVHNMLKEPDNGRASVMSAWRHTVATLNTTDRDVVLRKFFTKVDTVVNAINTSSTQANVTLSALWRRYAECSGAVHRGGRCGRAGRAAWTGLLKFFSMAVGNVSADIATYLTEANTDHVTLLQLLGFTSRTALYSMYDKIPELIGVLVNSYWDLGFMQQVRRASLSQFWDCEALLAALAPGPGSVSRAALLRLQPLVCPSLLYWLSMPTGANTLMDVVTKPQYLLFTLQVTNFESVYDQAYVAAANLSSTLKDLSLQNNIIDLSLDTLKSKLERAVDALISYRINDTDPSYVAFNEIMKKQSVSTIYLTRTTAIFNKIANLLNTLKIEDIVTNISDDDKKSIENDMNSLKTLFKRRASDVIGIHFDVITDVLWTNRNDYKLTNALEILCDNIKKNDSSKEILGDNTRIKAIICTKQYKIIYNAVQHVIDDDYDEARSSLLNIVKVLQTDEMDDVNNVFEFLKEKDSIVASLKRSIKYASDLDIPIYLQYLGSSLQHHSVVLGFLAGDDWWSELRGLYAGELATSFLDSVEKSFDIADDVLNNLDQIHVVRLVHDLSANSSACAAAGGARQYAPDAGGRLSALLRPLCADRARLLEEVTPLRFAAQGYEDSLKLPSTVNYNDLNAQISKAEIKLASIVRGPQSPRRPEWVSDENIARFRGSVLDLLSKRTLTKISFGLLSNVVDASTLYLNNTYCSACPQATSWAKQLTLQLFKKQDYDRLLCGARGTALRDIQLALRDRFHWDMAVGELISTRNYTKYELNKSLNELLEQVKLHLLEELAGGGPALAACLAKDVNRNALGNATLVINLLSGISRVLRSYLPHLQHVPGFTAVPVVVQLQADVARNLDVHIPLEQLQRDDVSLTQDLDQIIDATALSAIKYSTLNINTVKGFPLENSSFKLNKTLCQLYNCTEIIKLLSGHLNTTLISQKVTQLPDLQEKEFWRFNFISNILEPVEVILEHVGVILRFLSKMDLEGVLNGKLTASIDFVMQMLMDDTLHGWLPSVEAILEQLAPLLRDSPLQRDVTALLDGLRVLAQLKNYVIEHDINITLSDIFKNPDRIELSLKEIGVNNTAFWSVAENLYGGQIHLEPILSQKYGLYSIKPFTCQEASLAQVLVPGNLDNVTSEKLYSAVKEQFCDMEDDQAKKIVPVLIENINFTFVLDQVKSFLLTKLYAASNLSAAEGAAVLARAAGAAELLPRARRGVADLTAALAAEPLVQRLRAGFSIGDLMSSPELLAGAGRMVCGKPFHSGVSRFYKTIVSSVDLSSEPDEEQLRVLPTEFCRSMYADVVAMEGGKIVWSFVKPLLMGKILYTPPSPAVRRVVEQANSTFTPMAKMFNLIHSFADAFSSIDKMSAHRAGLKALQQLLAAEEYREIRVALLGDVSAPHVDVDELLDGIGDSEALGRLLGKASQFARCLNLDRFQPAPDERRLAAEAARLAALNEFTAGLVFLNMTETQTSLPLNIEYKIRMDIENSPTTKRTKNYLWTPGPEASFLENMRYFRGFIQVQDIVEKAIIQLSSGRRKRQVSEEADWAVYTQQNPYPCYRKDLFQTSLYESQALIVAFFFSFLFTVSSAVRFILVDKESGNTMLMSVMGVELRWHTLAWFLSSLLEVTATMLLVTAVLHYGRVLPTTAPSLIFALLFIFGLSVLSFCYLMGKLFSSASAGAVCAALGYLTTFMPFVLILSLEAVLTSGLKIVVSLSMSSALCYAFLFIARAEAAGAGAGWAQLWAPGGDMSIAAAAGMMLLDACLYFTIGYLVETFWGLKKVQSNITHIASTDEKAGVSIINITKVYGRGTKPALAGVSMELRPGQVTTLLGHNGAGKSTLINILTGMLQPSSGQVVVRAGVGGARVGVCPQRDVLYEQLSAREHVHLYARLNRAPRAEVDRILEAVSLGAVGAERAARLSGGSRRRLCVALAFVGRPHLVTLDEPTSGVDPHARKEIWSMIMKLRANRTILLTTHHLDEAELLSDQVVIMHKGQIHTSGSPVEIKRSLGSGYRLTVHFEPADVTGEDMEENTKKVLEVAKSVAKNASLVDVAGGEVEVNVPFYDDHGVSNDFEALCSSLEEGEGRLGCRGFGVECTSLEQVLYNICRQQDRDTPTDTASKSASTTSMKDSAPLVPAEGPLRGSTLQQFQALLHKRYMHYTRNRWLLFLLLALPALFVAVAMGFASIRPPADNEVSLALDPTLYHPATDYLVPVPSNSSVDNETLARRVMDILRYEQQSRNWTSQDSLTCKCEDAAQQCEVPAALARPDLMLLPDVDTLNDWLVTSQQVYIEKRYGGYSASARDGTARLVAWYNNKGHHAAPAYLHRLNNALLQAAARPRAGAGTPPPSLALYTHPLKISTEQLNKDNVYQHIADAGISAMLLLGYSLVSAGSAIYLVTERTDKQKRLQLLCGVSPALYWATALLCDMIIILINLAITVVILKIFNFPVFVARNNLPAICILILLYGYGCAGVVHVLEKLFAEASLANMLLFCGNSFVALAGVALLLVLDIISDSDATDRARRALHKALLLSPQFALADGLLEVAKNTIQAQVLGGFGMDTYRDPLRSALLLPHYAALLAVGSTLHLLNLAIEYHCFDDLITRWFLRNPKSGGAVREGQGCAGAGEDREGDGEALREERRVTAAVAPLRLRTIGNINAGFVDSKEDLKGNSLKGPAIGGDVISCVHVSRLFPTVGGFRRAVDDLTLGIPPAQCTALLGQNGAGKSSTFAMLTAELRPSAGRLHIHDRPATRRDLCQGLISYCPQRDALDPLLTVRETLQFFCRLRGLTHQDEVIQRTVEQFDLTKYVEVRSGALSGGNRRKLSAAVAFMGRTPLVLLDEPTSGMDPGSRLGVSRGWARAAAGGRAVLVSTHALPDAARAHRVALLRAGRLRALAPLAHSLARFGGGYAVCARVCGAGEAAGGGARAVWARVAGRVPHASLTVAHATAIHFIVPTLATVGDKEVVTRVSEVFRVMGALQREGLVEDFTLNQTSLEQMFLNCSGESGPFTLEDPLHQPPASPSPSHASLPLPGNTYRRASDDLSIVTAL